MTASTIALGHLLDDGVSDRRRRRSELGWVALCAVGSALVVATLVLIIGCVAANGIAAISATFLTQGVVDYDQGGALFAILGTLQLVPLAAALAAPIGILAGIFVAEKRNSRVAHVVRVAAETMSGLPTIIVGVFVFTIIVAPTGQYSAGAGVIALAIIMLPVITRSVEEILLLVPGSVREASLALGIPAWRTSISVVLRTALAGVLTAVMLGVSRGAAETASLVLTAYGGGQAGNFGDLGSPTDSLPTFIYANSISPDPVLVTQAWGASLVLLVIVLALNLLVRNRSIGRRAI